MSKTDAWFPLYIGDYLADTMHLTPAQHGAYLLLLMHHWRAGPLPDDDAQLAAIARTEFATWRKSVGPVVRPFFDAADGCLTQKRLLVERDRTMGITEKRSVAGKDGAAKRWGKTKGEPSQIDSQTDGNGSSKTEGKPDSEPIANAIAEPSQSNSKSMLTTVTVTERKKEAATRERASDPPSPPQQPPVAMPCRNDPPERWMHLAHKTEVSKEGVRKPVRNGWYLDDVADLVCQAAKIRTESWRGDWRPLMAWLDDGIDVHLHILPAIKRCAERPNYVAPGSLRYFDGMVREEFAKEGDHG